MRSQKNWNILRRLTQNFTSQTSHLAPLQRVPFENKGFRYKVFFLLFPFSFLLFCFTNCDKEETLMNRWNLQYVSVNGSSLTDSSQYHLLTRYTDYVFFIENRLTVDTYAYGQYTSSADGYYKLSNKSTLEMRFRIFDQINNITAKIKKLNRKELHLEYTDNGNTYFLKLYTN